MKITILTTGTCGDVYPYIALGEGLKATGYHVVLATHASFESLIRSKELGFFLVPDDPRTIEIEGGIWVASGSIQSQIIYMLRKIRHAIPTIRRMLDCFWDACRSTDVILFSTLAGFAVGSIIEKLKIPAIPALPQHVHQTRSYPSSTFSLGSRTSPILNLLTYSISEHLFFEVIRPVFNRWRKQTLDLPVCSLKSPLQNVLMDCQLCLYGFSPVVLPKPLDWDRNVYVTGYWFLENCQWKPDVDLVAFLEGGPPPVYIGFGSMGKYHARELINIARESLIRSGQRGVLQFPLSGWSGIDPSGTIVVINSAPHEWLFPYMSIVVHHGGAGTTGKGLRAGIPSVIVPFIGDQYFWGWRVEQLGVGPRPIPWRKLSAKRLADAITNSINDREMKCKAANVGQQIVAEDGVLQAVTLIDRFLSMV